MGLTITKKAPATKQPSQVTETTVKKNKGEVIAEDQKQTEGPALSTAQTQVAQHELGLCEVGFEASYTKNLGDFNSTRIQVSLKVPCPHGEINAVYDKSVTWVNDRLAKLVEDLEQGAE